MGFNNLKIYKINLVLFFTLFLSFLNAAGFPVPQINPAFTINKEDGTPVSAEVLSGSDIIDYALTFEQLEVNSKEWNDARAKYRQLAAEVSVFRNRGEEEIAEKIMSVMYDKVLSYYVKNQTRISVALLQGKYNCVSSCLLFLALAKECGLDVKVQETSVHAFASIYAKDGQKYDVETTNPQGFNPGTKKMVSQNSNGTKKYSVVPKNYYSNRMEISDRKAVTLVAKNICAEYNAVNDYVHGIPLSAAVLYFVTKEKSQVKNDFDAICVNYAAYANQKEEYETALDFLEGVIDRYGTSPLLEKNYNDIAYNSAAQSCNVEKYSQARHNFARRTARLTAQTSSEIETMIYESEKIDEIQKLIKSGKYLEAVKLCDEGLTVIPQSSLFKRAKSNSLYNHGVKIHNEVIPLMNNGNYKKALSILEEASRLNPENSLIKNDIANVKKKLN